MPVPERPIARAHRELAAVLRPGDLAIDATAGNGHDTVFLAAAVGETGRVLTFDVQTAAVTATKARASAAGLEERIVFIHASHATLADHVSPGSTAAIVFNLGYLPGGDHTLITRTVETLAALDQAVAALRPGGVLAIVCYPGHPGGDEESEAVVTWSCGLADSLYEAETVRSSDTPRASPFLVLVTKKPGAS